MTAAPDYADLVRRLRGIYRVGLGDPPEFGTRKFDGLPPIQGEAADAIEALAARVAELEAKDMRFSQREPTAMRARIAALEAERDALRADFERYAQHALPSPWHPPGCLTREMHPPSQTFSFKCDCGLDAARARWAKERT